MFLYLLLTLFVFIICYVLPLVGTLLSHENPQKWVAYWLVQLVSGFVLIPLLGQLFEVEIQLVVKILLSLALIVLLNQKKVSGMHSGVETMVMKASEHKKVATSRVGAAAKDYGLID